MNKKKKKWGRTGWQEYSQISSSYSYLILHPKVFHLYTKTIFCMERRIWIDGTFEMKNLSLLNYMQGKCVSYEGSMPFLWSSSSMVYFHGNYMTKSVYFPNEIVLHTTTWEESLFLYCSLPPGGSWDAPAGDIVESPVSSIFICSVWCLYACLCLLISLVSVCVYSSSCLIFPHSLSAFIIMKLSKQLQPSQQEPRDSCSSTHAVWFYHTHVLLCSTSLQSSCIYLMWNWVEQWRDAKAVVWSAWWRVESSPRWPLSAGGGGAGVSRGFDGVMDWCHSGQTCSAEVMISSQWWKRRNSNLFFLERGGGVFFSLLELKVLLFCSRDLWSP